MTRRRAALSAAVMLIASPVAAHHGWAEYGNAEFTLAGTVVSASLGNPHGVIRVRDAQGQVWDAVLGPPSNQRRAGLTEAAVPPGATVEAHGHRHRDGARLEMKTERLRVGDRVFDIYPNRS